MIKEDGVADNPTLRSAAWPFVLSLAFLDLTSFIKSSTSVASSNGASNNGIAVISPINLFICVKDVGNGFLKPFSFAFVTMAVISWAVNFTGLYKPVLKNDFCPSPLILLNCF